MDGISEIILLIGFFVFLGYYLGSPDKPALDFALHLKIEDDRCKKMHFL